jgi:hypothetical protein
MDPESCTVNVNNVLSRKPSSTDDITGIDRHSLEAGVGLGECLDDSSELAAKPTGSLISTSSSQVKSVTVDRDFSDAGHQRSMLKAALGRGALAFVGQYRINRPDSAGLDHERNPGTMSELGFRAIAKSTNVLSW